MYAHMRRSAGVVLSRRMLALDGTLAAAHVPPPLVSARLGDQRVFATALRKHKASGPPGNRESANSLVASRREDGCDRRSWQDATAGRGGTSSAGHDMAARRSSSCCCISLCNCVVRAGALRRACPWFGAGSPGRGRAGEWGTAAEAGRPPDSATGRCGDEARPRDPILPRD